MDALEYLKLRTKEENEDYLLSFIDEARDVITSYCGIDEVPTALEGMVKSLALRAYNAQGIEGFSSFSQGGTSITSRLLTREDRTRLGRYALVTVGEGAPAGDGNVET